MTTPSLSRNQLIADHSDIARRIALKVARRCPDWIAREDLVAAGMLGLTEAADRYDQSRKEPFLSFAEHRIRGAILDELRRGDLLPRRVRQLARKVSGAVRQLENRGETASDQGVAQELGVSLERYQTRLAHLAHIECESLEASRTVALVATDAAAPDEQADHRAELDRVKQAFDGLQPRDVTILGLYYVEELTYLEISKKLGITPSRVCQLLWRAVAQLRAQLGVVDEPVRAAA